MKVKMGKRTHSLNVKVNSRYKISQVLANLLENSKEANNKIF